MPAEAACKASADIVLSPRLCSFRACDSQSVGPEIEARCSSDVAASDGAGQCVVRLSLLSVGSVISAMIS